MHGEYKVYVHVNKINGKIYIGQTKQTLEQRYKNGYEHCRHFWNAIQKYGWDNFEHIILVDNLSLDMANILELVGITFNAYSLHYYQVSLKSLNSYV